MGMRHETQVNPSLRRSLAAGVRDRGSRCVPGALADRRPGMPLHGSHSDAHWLDATRMGPMEHALRHRYSAAPVWRGPLMYHEECGLP